MSTLEQLSGGVSTRAAVRAGAAIGGLAGAARMVSAFTPYVEGSVALEAFYALIDVGLLFGTLAIYAHVAGRVGWVGLAGFAATLAGLASIVGPDGYAFGIDLWRLGVVIISVGLALLSVQLYRRCRDLRTPARFWIAYLVAFVGAGLGMMGDVGGVVAGLLFGGGYVTAAIILLTDDDDGATEA